MNAGGGDSEDEGGSGFGEAMEICRDWDDEIDSEGIDGRGDMDGRVDNGVKEGVWDG